MRKVANSLARSLPHRHAQLMNHPAAKHKATLKRHSSQKTNLKINNSIYLRWQ